MQDEGNLHRNEKPAVNKQPNERPNFIPGIDLAKAFWEEKVRPTLVEELPNKEWAVALIGYGSDVLGFDTVTSTDHAWGPRVIVFLDEATLGARASDLDETLDRSLPQSFRGYSVRFPRKDGAEPHHQVVLTSVRSWFREYLGFDPLKEIVTREWLMAPSQILRAVTSGAVFEDNLGDLTKAREKLAWYPDDVWIYLLGCQWRRLDQEEPFVGRTGEVGDELGSAIVAARLVRDLVRLCFLIERQYAPYIKWLGTAFSGLRCGPTLRPTLESVLRGRDWHEREEHLVNAFESVAELFNDLGVAESVEPKVRLFHGRPFRVLGSGSFVDACMRRTPLSELGFTGSLDQLADSTDALSNPEYFKALGANLWS